MKKTSLILSLLVLLVLTQGLPALAQHHGTEHDEGDHEDHARKIREITVERLKDGPCRALKVAGGDVAFLGLGSQGYLGIRITTLTPELCAHFGVGAEHGVLVSKVEDDSPALRAGLQVGDVITRVGGEEVGSANQLSLLIRRREADEAVDVEYWRDGKVATATATIDAKERCGFDFGGLIELKELEHAPHFRWEGMDEEAAERLRERFELSGEAMEEAMQRLQEVFEDRELEKHLKHVEEINVEAIEKKMEEVQKRLERLEKELEQEREKLHEGGQTL